MGLSTLRDLIVSRPQYRDKCLKIILLNLFSKVLIEKNIPKDEMIWTEIQRSNMAVDFSWERSASYYETIYKTAAEKSRGPRPSTRHCAAATLGRFRIRRRDPDAGKNRDETGDPPPQARGNGGQ